MYVNNDILDDEIGLWLEFHDSKTNTNLTAELHGTVAEIGSVLRKSIRLMVDAGFVPGWQTNGKNGGTIHYIILVREAVERCWSALRTHC